MSSVVIAGNTSGTITLDAPNVAGTTTLTLPTTSGTIVTSASSLTASQMPAGSVLQVVSATKTDTASTGSSTFADITGLSVSITPSSASNKILIIASINLGWDNTIAKVGSRLMRDSTAIAVGDTAGSRIRLTGYLYVGVTCETPFVVSANHLDSPSSTSALTYKWQFSALDNAGTVYVNRGTTDANSTNVGRPVSSITVMEIKG
jgi:hypothetical protein